MEALTIKPEGWNEEAADLLQGAAHDELIGVETIRQQVAAGAVLYVSRLNGRAVFAHVVWINELENGREAVVSASSGVALAGVHLSRIMLEDIARRYHFCARVRVTSSRRGMDHILERQGFEKQSTNYTKMIGGTHVF